MLQTTFLSLVFISVGFWEYCMFFKKKSLLPLSFGFDFFSLLLWVFVVIGSFGMFGFAQGILIIVLSVFILQYLTHFTIGLILNYTVKEKVGIILALFPIMILILGIVVIASFF